MTSIQPAVLAAGLAALLTLSGCGKSAAPEQAASNDTNSAAKTTSYPTQPKKACEILTQRIATSLLGGLTESAGPIRETGSASVRISSCVRTSSLNKIDKSGAVSLVVHVAQTSAGAQTNAEAFDPDALPRSAQEVLGYDEKAFWDPTLGQLNILHEGNWFILASGPIDPTKHTLAQTKKLAAAVADDL